MTLQERIIQIPRLANTPGIAPLSQFIEEVLRELKEEITLRAQQSATELERDLLPNQIDRPRPAIGLAAFEVTQQTEIDVEQELGSQTGEKSFLFTPVYRGNCYPLQVRYLCTNGLLRDVKSDSLAKEQVLAHPIDSLFAMGLESELPLDSLEGLQLYFSNINKETIEGLSLAHAFYNGKAYRLVPATMPSMSDYDQAHTCDREYLYQANLRTEIAKKTAVMGLFRLECMESDYSPTEFDTTNLDITTEENKTLRWLQLLLPECVKEESLINCNAQLNVFPVWNMWKARRTEIPTDNQNKIIIPLTNEEGNPADFFALARVWSRPEYPYFPQALFPNKAGTYKLSSRNSEVISDIDITSTVDLLEKRMDIVNPAALREFAQGGEDELQPQQDLIRNFLEAWQELKPALQGLKNLAYYLEINPAKGEKVVFVDIWKTNPEANDILWPLSVDLTTPLNGVVSIKMMVTPNETSNLLKKKEDHTQLLQNRLFPIIPTTRES